MDGVGIKRALEIGAVGGLAVLYVCAVGMVGSFNDRQVVTGWLTLGDLVLWLPVVAAGFVAGGRPKRVPTPSAGAVVVDGVIAGVGSSITAIVSISIVIWIGVEGVRGVTGGRVPGSARHPDVPSLHHVRAPDLRDRVGGPRGGGCRAPSAAGVGPAGAGGGLRGRGGDGTAPAHRAHGDERTRPEFEVALRPHRGRAHADRGDPHVRDRGRGDRGVRPIPRTRTDPAACRRERTREPTMPCSDHAETARPVGRRDRAGDPGGAAAVRRIHRLRRPGLRGDRPALGAGPQHHRGQCGAAPPGASSCSTRSVRTPRRC